MGWLEGNGCLPTALRATGHSFGFGETRTGRSLALGLASFTALRFVLKILIVEEVLFSRGKYKIRSAIHTFEVAVLKLRHGLIPVDDLEQFIGPRAGDDSRPVYTPGVLLLVIPLPGATSSGFVYGPKPV